MTESVPNSSPPLTTNEKIMLFFLPNIGDIIFMFFLQLPLFLLPSFVFGDGSTGWHIATGEYILRTHEVPQKDLISNTFPDAPWVAYQWLSDVIMAAMYNFGGMNMVAVSVSCAIGWLILLIYQRCRKEGVHFALALPIVMIGVIVTAIHWLARPHIFTWFGVYIFVTRLEDYYRGEISGLRLLIPLTVCMLFWVNTHPAFLIGLIVLVIYLASASVSAIYFRGAKESLQYTKKAMWIGVTTVICAVVSFLNPYGTKLHAYIFAYLKGGNVIAATDEFQSPVFHGKLQPVCLELLFAFFIVGLAVGRKRLSLPLLITCLAFCHLALSAVRNMPLFVIVVVPAIALLLSDIDFPVSGPALSSSAFWTGVKAKWSKLTAIFDENEALCNKHLWPLVAFLFLTIASTQGGHLMGVDLKCDWNPKNFPTKTLSYLAKLETDKKVDPNRGFNYDNWGGYLLHKLGTRVFIDDRADFYGEKFYYRYGTVSQVQPGWQDILKENQTQWVLMPKNSRLCAALREDHAWKEVATDEASSLFLRQTE